MVNKKNRTLKTKTGSTFKTERDIIITALIAVLFVCGLPAVFVYYIPTQEIKVVAVVKSTTIQQKEISVTVDLISPDLTGHLLKRITYPLETPIESVSPGKTVILVCQTGGWIRNLLFSPKCKPD